MATMIRISHPDGAESLFEYNPDFGIPLLHALELMESAFPEDAEAGEIYSDGARWYTENGAEARWFEKD